MDEDTTLATEPVVLSSAEQPGDAFTDSVNSATEDPPADTDADASVAVTDPQPQPQSDTSRIDATEADTTDSAPPVPADSGTGLDSSVVEAEASGQPGADGNSNEPATPDAAGQMLPIEAAGEAPGQALDASVQLAAGAPLSNGDQEIGSRVDDERPAGLASVAPVPADAGNSVSLPGPGDIDQSGAADTSFQEHPSASEISVPPGSSEGGGPYDDDHEFPHDMSGEGDGMGGEDGPGLQAFDQAGPGSGETPGKRASGSGHGHTRRSRVYPKIDRGFFMSEGDWTCYRRNYFQVSATFTAMDMTGLTVGLPCYVEKEGMLRSVTGFLVNVTSKTASGSREIELVQHTAKRDKGPQNIPQPRICEPQDSSLRHDDSFHSVTFERLQFKAATANNGKRRAAQQYHVLVVEVVVQCDNGLRFTVAASESSPLVVRGRAPGHYAQMETKQQMTRHGVPVPMPRNGDSQDQLQMGYAAQMPAQEPQYMDPDEAARQSQPIAFQVDYGQGMPGAQLGPAMQQLPASLSAGGYTYAYSTPHPSDPTGATMVHYYQPLAVGGMAQAPSMQYYDPSMWATQGRLGQLMVNPGDATHTAAAVAAMQAGGGAEQGGQPTFVNASQQAQIATDASGRVLLQAAVAAAGAGGAGGDQGQAAGVAAATMADYQQMAVVDPITAASMAAAHPYAVIYAGADGQQQVQMQVQQQQAQQYTVTGVDQFGQAILAPQQGVPQGQPQPGQPQVVYQYAQQQQQPAYAVAYQQAPEAVELAHQQQQQQLQHQQMVDARQVYEQQQQQQPHYQQHLFQQQMYPQYVVSQGY
ncbi:hypothetical protein HK405_010004, partial [Cladochytrium tenue]